MLEREYGGSRDYYHHEEGGHERSVDVPYYWDYERSREATDHPQLERHIIPAEPVLVDEYHHHHRSSHHEDHDHDLGELLAPAWPLQRHRDIDEHEYLTELSPADVRKIRIEEDLEEIAQLKAQEH